MGKRFFLVFVFTFIWFTGCTSNEKTNTSQPASENKTSSVKLATEATISGVKVKVQSAERVKILEEGKSKITAGEGQEFYKVTFSVNADNAIDEFNKWRINFVEANDAESAPAFNWKFSDKQKSLAWVYTYPKPINTQFKGIMIEDTVLALPDK